MTVHTNADAVTVSPPADAATSGVRIIDGTGKAVTSAKNGSKLYFDVPDDAAGGAAHASGGGGGTAELTVQASTTVPVGRAFASESRSQTQILAGSSESTVSATATAGWAAEGAIPAVSARKNCAKGGVDVTAANKGDEPFTFRLMGAEHTIPAGASRTVTVPLQEDRAYDFTITGPHGFSHRFTGVLDCKTQGAISTETAQLHTEPSPRHGGRRHGPGHQPGRDRRFRDHPVDRGRGHRPGGDRRRGPDRAAQEGRRLRAREPSPWGWPARVRAGEKPPGT